MDRAALIINSGKIKESELTVLELLVVDGGLFILPSQVISLIGFAGIRRCSILGLGTIQNRFRPR
jgi:hypothetical protein